jgi:adenylate kinase family enzyme
MIETPGILLVGPTGAGKTPLGEHMEAEGLWGRRAFHFDFGRQLRDIAAGAVRPGLLAEDDLAVVRASLATGALLENETFHIARDILLSFLASRGCGPGDVLVMNGLPRHVGQARDLDGILGMRGVVHLDCSPAVVQQRIRSNAGGDREGREDDSLAFVARKLELFRNRTFPLLDHYRGLGVRLFDVDVQVNTTPLEIVARLESDAFPA